MWFMTEIFPGLFAIVTIVILATHNINLRKVIRGLRLQLQNQEVIYTAIPVEKILEALSAAKERSLGIDRSKTDN